jgi:hypothetical protein
MNTYYIRYNTQHGETDLVWRIFENGQEHLVQNFHINVPTCGEVTLENGMQKWNVSCQGYMSINDGIAIIDKFPTHHVGLGLECNN